MKMKIKLDTNTRFLFHANSRLIMDILIRLCHIYYNHTQK